MSTVHHVVKLKIEDGATQVTENFPLPLGYVSGVALYTNGKEKETLETLEIAMLNDSSVELLPSVHIDHWKQTGGGYKDSFKPLNFETLGKNFGLRLISDKVSDGSVIVYVVFLYDLNRK